ncbi:MAG: exodeoxyribonuclease VII small subunit [Rhodoferax sp.]
MTKITAATTFRQAYGVLQQHAETLRNQDEPNIDDLLNIVTESVGAYKVCQERIDAVEKALEKALGETAATPKDARSGAKTEMPASAATAPASAPQDGYEIDDIPF